MVPGVLHRTGTAPPVGVPWLDAEAEDAVRVRFSRAALPAAAAPAAAGEAAARGGVHLAGALRDPRRAMMIAARPVSGGDYEPSGARVAGPWRPFARLRVPTAEGPDDDAVDFDPVRHPVPGLGVPPRPDRLRSDAYAASRRGRGAA